MQGKSGQRWLGVLAVLGSAPGLWAAGIGTVTVTPTTIVAGVDTPMTVGHGTRVVVRTGGGAAF